MLSKSLIQFSVDGRGCVPSLLEWHGYYSDMVTINLRCQISSPYCFLGFSCGLAGKDLPADAGDVRIWSLGWEDSLEQEMATHSSILAWELPWTEEPGGLQTIRSQRVGHDWVCMHTYTISQLVFYIFLVDSPAWISKDKALFSLGSQSPHPVLLKILLIYLLLKKKKKIASWGLLSSNRFGLILWVKMSSENPIHCQMLFTMLLKIETITCCQIWGQESEVMKSLLWLVRQDWKQNKTKTEFLLSHSVYVFISDLQ